MDPTPHSPTSLAPRPSPFFTHSNPFPHHPSPPKPGGTRGVGKNVILQALEQGHSITALARDPSKIETDDDVMIIKGDATDSKAVDETIRGSQGVVVSLGTGVASNPADISVCSTATPLILHSMKKHKVKRVVVVTSMGVGDSFNDISERARVFLKPYLDDKEIQERYLREIGADLEWIVVRPAGEGDVADFVLKQFSDDAWLRQTPSLSGVN
ncbi:hypothetical protein HDU97_005725 [Phlyctochytrium planicorne]|nr:hypothetical protein HDU97_005725 [Phlyctochytrium planicorne]